MGSLTSGPDIPAPTPQVVYVPQPVNTTTTSASTATATDTQAEEQEVNTEARRQNLLGRERSRFGTINTSFRGVLGLSDASTSAQRKTLLGE